NWGGYLTWALYPDYPVFVDGRTDLYEDAFLREYLRTAQGAPGWEATLERYGVRLVLVEADSGLDRELGRSAGWTLAYRDELAVVYARTTAR
ncbi:MAG: hypothetical protein HY784_01565, partial [Chloroflexi bacterium]|nr:hypothetical protein [Chloroflexota bacterium]